MIEKYVNLSQGGSGYAGTDIDPYSFADFKAYLATNPAETTFYMTGSHSAVDFIDYYDAGFTGTHHIYPWHEEPWRMQLTYWSFRVPLIAGGGVISCTEDFESYGGDYRSCVLYADRYWFVRGNSSIKGSLIRATIDMLFDGAGNSVVQDCLIKASLISDYYSPPTSVLFNNNAIDCPTRTVSNATYTDCQLDWTAPTLPPWHGDEGDYLSTVLLADVSVPPRPGNVPYAGYEQGLWGEDRLDIGGCYFVVSLVDKYVDLDQAGTGGSGSEGDPWKAGDFKAECEAVSIPSGATVFIKGMHDYGVEQFLFDGQDDITFKPWNLNDPWRIRASSIFLGNSSNQNAHRYERAILEASDDSIAVNEKSTLVTCFLRANGSIIFNTGVGGALIQMTGSTFVSPSLLVEVGSDPRAQDCIFDCETIGGFPAGFISDKSLFTAAAPGGTHTDVQDDWTPPVWPVWNLSKHNFSARILEGVTTPPQPGLEPYTGYATGLFNNPRYGIGGLFFPFLDMSMNIELRDRSTGIVDDRLWELYNHETDMWDAIETGDLITHLFDLTDTRYGEYIFDGFEYVQYLIRLTVTNPSGSDSKTRAFRIKLPPPH